MTLAKPGLCSEVQVSYSRRVDPHGSEADAIGGDAVRWRGNGGKGDSTSADVVNAMRVTDVVRILAVRDSDGREQTLQTTDDHPFCVIGRGWTDARSLAIGYLLQEPRGSVAMLIATRREEHPEGIEVFNFRVEGTHGICGNTGAPVGHSAVRRSWIVWTVLFPVAS